MLTPSFPSITPSFRRKRESSRSSHKTAEAGEIKGTALYLASDAANFTTGLMLVTDGGCMAK